MSLRDRITEDLNGQRRRQCPVAQLETTHPDIHAELVEILKSDPPPMGTAVARALKAEYGIDIPAPHLRKVGRQLRGEA